MQKLKLETQSLLLVISALLLGVCILAVSVFRVSQGQVMAQTGVEEEVEVIGDEEKTEEVLIAPLEEEAETGEEEEASPGAEALEEGKVVDYYLAYPGILPDHPLYWLKMIRDRIMLLITKKPLVRFDRLLLYADKRIGAAKILIEGGKAELGVTTATKAEKYLEQAVDQFLTIEDPGLATPEEKERLGKAIAKHEAVLLELKEKAPDQSKAGLDTSLEKNIELQGKIKGLLD